MSGGAHEEFRLMLEKYKYPPWLLDAFRAEMLREAVTAAAAERLVDDTGHPRDEGYNAAIDDVVSALTRMADEATP